MAGKKRAKYSDWLRTNVFREETLSPPKKLLPEPLQQARSLERPGAWGSLEATFLKQARMLADYEDNYDYRGKCVCYYATYQAMKDNELRGYFSWRTKVRQGEFRDAPICFLYVYIYELINQIGTATPAEGYAKLLEIKLHYEAGAEGQLHLLDRWLLEYAVYYNLDPALLDDIDLVRQDRALATLENIKAESQENVIAAVKQLCPKWLRRSRFYQDRQAEMDAVIYRVLLRIDAHYAKGNKKPMLDQYFGSLRCRPFHIFSNAIFSNPLRRKNYEYRLNSQRVYEHGDGLWYVWERNLSPQTGRKLEQVLKTIDSQMREALGYGHPVQPEIAVKWLNREIHEEIQALLAAKQAASRVKVDISQLAKIREDAESTASRLITSEEEESVQELLDSDESRPLAPQPGTPLAPAEYRLLQCLLYGGDRSWIQKEGFIVSVLVDGINEKLYDEFADSVLDDAPQVIEDYIDALKEIVQP